MFPSTRLFDIVVGLVAVLLLDVAWHNFGQAKYSLRDIVNMQRSGSQSTLGHADLHRLFSGIAQPIHAAYTDPTGKIFEMPRSRYWSKPLGKRILVLDIDTRMPNGTNELFGEKPMEWATHESKGGGLVSNAIMDHYLYAQIHGYDCKYVHAQQMDGYHVTWILPHILASLLPDYDFVLALDSDVTATQMEVPLEWLFNRWNITSQTSIAMPWDTLEERPDTHQILSQDSKGNQVLNTGFVLVQNLPFTFDMLQAWSECPTEKRYKGCGHWKKNWSHEQRAFSEFIRYDFNPQGDNIVPIACDDAMSWPGAVDERPGPYRLLNDCQGRFFRHHTWHKERPREEFQDSAMQLLTRLLQERVKQNVDTILIEESKGQLGRR